MEDEQPSVSSDDDDEHEPELETRDSGQFGAKEIEELFSKSTESFRCLADLLISHSSLLRQPLYHFPPLEDPGIEDAFNYSAPEPGPDDTGVEVYRRTCDELGIVCISRIVDCLPTTKLDLKYYGVTEKQTRALSEALKVNKYVKELILEDNWQTPEAIGYLMDMVAVNGTITRLNLAQCNVGVEGAQKLEGGLEITETITDLNLSRNGLGDDGFLTFGHVLKNNGSIKTLDLSHNGLGERSALVLKDIFRNNNALEAVDLSWNNFNTPAGTKAMCQGLSMNETVTSLSLAWNGIEDKAAAVPFAPFLRGATALQFLDLSSNRLTGDALVCIKNGMARCRSLVAIKLGSNLVTPEEAAVLAKVLKTSPISSLRYLDLENTFVEKTFLPLWKELTEAGKRVKIGGILGNYEIAGPDLIGLVFRRVRFVCAKAKRKKAQKDFGHLILTMPQQRVTKQEFQDLVKKFKAKKFAKDNDLVNELMRRFRARGDKVDLVKMRAAYLALYPDASLPPPKKKKGKTKKDKQETKTEVEVAVLEPVQDASEAFEVKKTSDGEVLISEPVGDASEGLEFKKTSDGEVLISEPAGDATEALEVEKTSEGDIQGIPGSTNEVTEPARISEVGETSHEPTETEVSQEPTEAVASEAVEQQSNV